MRTEQEIRETLSRKGPHKIGDLTADELTLLLLEISDKKVKQKWAISKQQVASGAIINTTSASFCIGYFTAAGYSEQSADGAQYNKAYSIIYESQGIGLTEATFPVPPAATYQQFSYYPLGGAIGCYLMPEHSWSAYYETFNSTRHKNNSVFDLIMVFISKVK